MNTFFIADVDKIFKEVGITKTEAPELYEESCQILSSCMAILSATMGMSYARVKAFDDQKASLAEDIRSLIAKGGLR